MHQAKMGLYRKDPNMTILKPDSGRRVGGEADQIGVSAGEDGHADESCKNKGTHAHANTNKNLFAAA